VSRIAAENRWTRAVPKSVADLTANGLSALPCQGRSFGAIIARFEADGFEIEDGVDLEELSAFVRAVDAAEP
jgi:hypothetical protein